jgi:hypothetical protein
VVVIASSGENLMSMPAATVRTAIFSLTLFGSFVYSIDSVLDAKERWRQLRGSAGALESIIFRYRTRVGEFRTQRKFGDDNTSSRSVQMKDLQKRAEVVLGEALSEWTETLLNNGTLHGTSLMKRYKDDIFRHHQFCESKNPPSSLEVDNFYSPVRPLEYIDIRLKKHLNFLQHRLPKYVRQSQILKMTLLLCSVAASVLAYVSFTHLVVIVTSCASVITSWTEFSDPSRKAERYTMAISKVERLLTWWETLSAVEAAGVENISRLIESGEHIIQEELAAWSAISFLHAQHDTQQQDKTFETGVELRMESQLSKKSNASTRRKLNGIPSFKVTPSMNSSGYE